MTDPQPKPGVAADSATEQNDEPRTQATTIGVARLLANPAEYAAPEPDAPVEQLTAPGSRC
jgi:hypothetical protein